MGGWGTEQEMAFDKVETSFTEDLQLCHPQQDRKYVVYTDARDYGVGSVLY